MTGPEQSKTITGSTAVAEVLRAHDCDLAVLQKMLGRFGLDLELVKIDGSIPGSYWGGEEAGLIGSTLLARPDTPVHSILHEACHFICMDEARRSSLHTDAGGDYDEENGVCYLQVLLSDRVPEMGRDRMFRDMDDWGYSFRLGSARSWFESDADDALRWLRERGLASSREEPVTDPGVPA